MTEQPNVEPTPAVGLDLIAPEMYAPALRRLALAALGVGIGVGLLSALFVSWPIALAVALVLGLPTALYALAAQRRRMSLAGTVIHAQTWRGKHTLDIAAATGVEVLVYSGRLSRVVLRVTAAPDTRIIPLAMYTDAGGGRELHLLGLRRLADALAACPLAAALAVSGVLVHQLRAEARDAVAEERPLYRAARMVRDRDAVQPVVLSDRDIAELVK
ncbi:MULTISPECIES: hypothetical protein [unclassified Nocardia]|uniref:hypothetical protein n=1 Tax=unclassified Nocardia TaxID=2637762 RepID=UPI0024A9994D|nr:MULTISPECIES: hypothetical protein [unclassified Nocardia]